MSDVPSLLAIRAHFALTQTELAAWLGLGRSMLAMVETGQEQLPRHARPWLRPWEAALAAAPPDELPAAAPPLLFLPPTGPAAVLARLAECHYQALRLGQQLGRLHTAHRTARRRLAAGPLLLAVLPPPSPTPEPEALTRRRRWLARLLEAATDALLPAAPTGPVAVALLAARRRAWQHEAELLRAYLQGEGLE